MFLIVKQILLVSTLINVQRGVWRIFILMLGCKGFRNTTDSISYVLKVQFELLSGHMQSYLWTTLFETVQHERK